MEEYTCLETWGYGGPLKDPVRPHTDYTQSKKRIIYGPESRVLQQCKNEIYNVYCEGKWDDYKKITNPFEYIFLSWNRRTSRSVAIRQPLSRSYFKMIELWKKADITHIIAKLVERDGGLVSAHVAEGPGGFIEACQVSAERNGWNFMSATAITLQSHAKNVPGWRKACRFLDTYPQIKIHNGADGSGNILIKANQDAFVQSVRSVHPNGVHVFTADGGFDFSSDFNAQEETVFPLLFAETILGLQVLAKGGCLIIKCFDITEQPTIDLVWLISQCFCEWGIVKPQTSRAGNAERYIIGKGFLGNIHDILHTLLEYQERKMYNVPILSCETTPPEYKQLIHQLMHLQEQIEHVEINIIRETLDLIRYKEPSLIKKLVHHNIVRSIAWCKIHGEEINSIWNMEQEKQIAKETSDLISLLNATTSYNVWYKSTSSNHVSFAGFRSEKQST